MRRPQLDHLECLWRALEAREAAVVLPLMVLWTEVAGAVEDLLGSPGTLEEVLDAEAIAAEIRLTTWLQPWGDLN